MVDFVATGGYALKTYERFARIKQDKRTLARRQSARAAELPPQRRHHRRGGDAESAAGALARRRLGFDRRHRARRRGCSARSRNISSKGSWPATPSCSAARSCATRRWSRIRSTSRAPTMRAKVPSYMGGKFPLSTYLAERVRKLLDDKRAWAACRIRCANGCRCSRIFRACRMCAR